MQATTNSIRAAVALGAVALVLGSVAPTAASGRTGGTGTTACNDGSITWTPTTIWPPNHKMVDVSVSYADTDSDHDSISLQIMSITDNEMLPNGDELNGSGQPNPPQGADFAWDPTPVNGSDPGTVSTTVQVRAERAGTGDGRVYDIKARCTDKNGMSTTDTGEDGPMGESQTVDLTVTVPHDQGEHTGQTGATAGTTSSSTAAPAAVRARVAPVAGTRISATAPRGLRLL